MQANVLISDDHHALLADFGLALKLFQIRSQSAFSADLNRRRGTLLWMAPEVLSGNKVPDKAADVYSLGLTIWEVSLARFRNTLVRSDLTYSRPSGFQWGHTVQKLH